MSAEQFREKVFAIHGKTTVDISNICGAISVRGSGRTDVCIRVRKDAHGNESLAEATVVDMGQDGDRVWAKTQFRHGMTALYGLLDGNGRPADVYYEVECPGNATVIVNGLSCSLSVLDINGDIRTNALSGNTDIARIHGDLSMNSVSGVLTASGITGRIRAKTVSGRIDVTQCHASEFRVNTVSGTTRLETDVLPEYGASITTVSGRCELAIPSTSACTIISHSVSGTVHCELPADVRESRRSRWRAVLNGGDTEITFNSVSGGLTVRASSTSDGHHAARAEAVPASPPRPSTPTPSSAANATEESLQPMEPLRPMEPLQPIPPMRPMEPMTPMGPMTSVTSGSDPRASDSDGMHAPQAASEDETLRILKAIERGDISVDEGLAQLEAVEAKSMKGGTHNA